MPSRRDLQNVVRFTWYVVEWEKEKMEAFEAGVEQAAREFELSTPRRLSSA